MSEVTELLDAVAVELEALQEQRDRLASRLGEFAERDLKSEFEKVGREVTEVLEAARQAADTMRERASLDASRWRSEAMAETEQLRKDAKNDAEALRGDAWTTGTDLLNQVLAEVRRLGQQAERDAITITGEAEREAHRLVSTARREAEDLLRAATMDAEKMAADAAKSRDVMIEEARKQAEASQERTRALELRREELMKELDAVRATLGQLEGTLEAKREDLNLSRSTESTVKVVPAASRPSEPPSPPKTWEPGETVRVIRPADESEPPVISPVPDPEPIVETVPAEPLAADEGGDAESPTDVEATEEVVLPEDTPPIPDRDDVGALFASLKSPEEVAQTQAGGASPDLIRSSTPAEESPAVPAPETELTLDDDLLESRDAALLPIANRALRGVKRAVTEAQNIALDSLRTDSSWVPDQSELVEILRADLIALWAESYSAGHHMAESLTGAKLKRRDTPSNDSAQEFASDLKAALEKELAASGDGQRERQSAASRVFRGWRTDESERRVRELSLRGYHRGLVESASSSKVVWVPSGKPCSACREAAKDPASQLPPVHAGCECSVTISG